ncbi:MAG: glycoside hydrolase family 32 protein [bacterium]
MSKRLKKSWPEKYPSPVPRQVFSRTLAAQERELKADPVLLRFARSRTKLAADAYRPLYHFVSPENELNDPNGLCYWKGRWHLFYQGYPADEFPAPADIPKRRQHWGHAVSKDLVHWRDLPYAIHPGIEKMCFSGGTVVEKNQVVAFYPGIEAGQMVAVARDPLLLNWNKVAGNPVMRAGEPMGDSCIWKEGSTYLGLIGARCLVASKNLVDWKIINGNFLAGPPFPIDDGSCPTFLPIGDKHILLLFSHSRGGQYLLGAYDRKNHQFTADEHGRFNHGNVAPGGVHAPSAAMDGRGGVVNILNINDGKHSDDWNQIMSLAQRLTLGPDKRLRIEPVEANSALRGRHQRVCRTVMPANKEIVLNGIVGNSMELSVEIDPQELSFSMLRASRYQFPW